jgi:hypothetical protein
LSILDLPDFSNALGQGYSASKALFEAALITVGRNRSLLICERCRAGQMIEYRRKLGDGSRTAEIIGMKCDRCGYTELDNDEDVWAAVGL